MLSEEDLEKEMLEDLDYLYQNYRKTLDSKRTNVKTLNNLIRALKEVHRYYSLDDDNESNNDQNTHD